MSASVNNLKSRPRYQEVHNTLAHEIAVGGYAPGSTLPGVGALCQRFGVSSDTVTHALKELAAEGMIRCRRGSLPRVLPFRECKETLKIAILLDSEGAEDPCKYSYVGGSWCWCLHQQLMLQLLEAHYPVINLSWHGDWLRQLDGVDGVIVINACWELLHMPEPLEKLHIPFVRIQSAAMMPELPPWNTLYVSDDDSDRKLATYFLANGMERFVIHEYSNFPLADVRNRHHVLYEMLRAAGIPDERIHPLHSHFWHKTGRRGRANAAASREAEQFLRESREPVGMTVNEFVGGLLVPRAQKLGKRFKKDCSIAARLNIPVPLRVDGVTASLVETPMAEIASEALDMLYSMIRSRSERIANRPVSTKFTIFDT